jgi:hypothetical protein
MHSLYMACKAAGGVTLELQTRTDVWRVTYPPVRQVAQYDAMNTPLIKIKSMAPLLQCSASLNLLKI